MSDTLHLACVTCHKELWIGQGGYAAPRRAYLYSTDEHRAEFMAFWDEHAGHDVRLVDADGFEALDPVNMFDAGLEEG